MGREWCAAEQLPVLLRMKAQAEGALGGGVLTAEPASVAVQVAMAAALAELERE